MKEQCAYIYGAAAHSWPVNEDAPADFKPRLQAAWGKRFRRINHFTELTLAGAKSCLDQSRVPVHSDCDIYLASEHGNVAGTARITELLFKFLEAPMPLAFLNVPNNMAGFYLAQGLSLHSSNLTVAHRSFSFETALDLAIFNIVISRKNAPCALVGSVEECAYPLDQHRQRLGLTPNTPLAEGSSWLHIGGDKKGALARCEWLKFFSDRLSLTTFLERQNLPSSTYIARGYAVDESDLEKQAISNRYTCRDIILNRDTHCAFTIASFISQKAGECLVYINRNQQNHYAAVCISMLKND